MSAPRSAIPSSSSMTSRLRMSASGRSPHRGSTSRFMTRVTSPTVRLSGRSRLNHSSTAARTLSLGRACCFATVFCPSSPAGSRQRPPARVAQSFGPRRLDGPGRAKCTDVTLRRGSVRRPSPARYIRMKLFAPWTYPQAEALHASRPKAPARGRSVAPSVTVGPRSHIRLVSFRLAVTGFTLVLPLWPEGSTRRKTWVASSNAKLSKYAASVLSGDLW